ncbi:MAG: hypothetical protein V1859_10045 [archaeon]
MTNMTRPQFIRTMLGAGLLLGTGGFAVSRPPKVTASTDQSLENIAQTGRLDLTVEGGQDADYVGYIVTPTLDGNAIGSPVTVTEKSNLGISIITNTNALEQYAAQGAVPPLKVAVQGIKSSNELTHTVYLTLVMNNFPIPPFPQLYAVSPRCVAGAPTLVYSIANQNGQATVSEVATLPEDFNAGAAIVNEHWIAGPRIGYKMVDFARLDKPNDYTASLELKTSSAYQAACAGGYLFVLRHHPNESNYTLDSMFIPHIAHNGVVIPETELTKFYNTPANSIQSISSFSPTQGQPPRVAGMDIRLIFAVERGSRYDYNTTIYGTDGSNRPPVELVAFSGTRSGTLGAGTQSAEQTTTADKCYMLCGNELVFTNPLCGGKHIFAKNLATGYERTIANAESIKGLSSDGNSVVYTDWQGLDKPSVVYRTDIKGSAPVQVASLGCQAIASPDGVIYLPAGSVWSEGSERIMFKPKEQATMYTLATLEGRRIEYLAAEQGR